MTKNLLHTATIYLLALLLAAATTSADDVKYFTSDSLRGTLSTNNPPTQAMFHSGKYNRTYVTYRGDDFFAWVTYYDHDTGQWSKSIRVDDCRYDDGHNNPEILITKDGYVHLFYGTHYNPVKYARSLYPEDISRWRIGLKFGGAATYPNPLQLNNGDLLCFYRGCVWTTAEIEARTGIRHGFSGPLVVHRSTDNGRTWDAGTEILRFFDYEHGTFSRCYLRQIFYDATENMVYLALTDLDPDGKRKSTPYTVKYNPESRHMIAMNDVDLGEQALRQELIDNGCQARWGFVQWGTSRVLLLPPTGPGRGQMYTEDGVTIKGYGRATVTSGDIEGHDLVVWTSHDAGQTWDEGEVLVNRQELGEGVVEVALVRNYQGNGPVVIFQGSGGEPSAEFMQRYEMRQKYNIEPILLPWKSQPWSTGWNHYRIPGRLGARLYAVDAQGNLLY